MAGRAIPAATRQNSEPSWIAYMGFQMLLSPKEPDKPESPRKSEAGMGQLELLREAPDRCIARYRVTVFLPI